MPLIAWLSNKFYYKDVNHNFTNQDRAMHFQSSGRIVPKRKVLYCGHCLYIGKVYWTDTDANPIIRVFVCCMDSFFYESGPPSEKHQRRLKLNKKCTDNVGHADLTK